MPHQNERFKITRLRRVDLVRTIQPRAAVGCILLLDRFPMSDSTKLNEAITTLAEYAKRHLSNNCRLELVFDASVAEVTLELFDSLGESVEFDSEDSGFKSACQVSKELCFSYEQDEHSV